MTSFIPKHSQFIVLVPLTADHGIDPRSAIVTRHPLPRSAQIEIYYEGNRLGACNLHRFAERVCSAAGRHSERYPTIAKAVVPRDQFIEVARYDLGQDEITQLTNPKALAEWLDGEPLPEVGTERFRVMSPARAASDPATAYYAVSGAWTSREQATLFTSKHFHKVPLPHSEPDLRVEPAGRSVATHGAGEG